jgi:hypothetical protein
MRKALNDNPIVGVIVIGVLGIGVAFMLISSMGSSSSSSSSSTTPTTAATAAPATAEAAPTATAPTTAAPTTAAPSTPTAAPTDPTAVPATDPATAAAAAAPPAVGAFVAGPGLPSKVVTAYKGGDAIALLVVKKNGIDDKAVKVGFPIVSAIPRVAAFETLAKHVARYARIAEGVDLDRVPALVMIRPKSLTGSGPPQATVTYGFTGPAQLAQAAFDSLYKGAENLPYHPG